MTCSIDERREAVRVARNGDGHAFLNGIDFLEVSPADQTKLVVRFLQNVPGAASGAIPPPPAPEFGVANFAITGGVRITGIQVTAVARTADNEITVTVNQSGDFSVYTLHLVRSQGDWTAPEGFDPQLSKVDFSFKIACLTGDCKPSNDCPPEPAATPEINYLAKDYASFRRVVLDRMSLVSPNWRERSAADMGIALVELLSYVGDYLSYRQDAIGTEAYLGTARTRTSVRRHARLVDYRVHDGSNARAWVQIRVATDVTSAPGDPPRIPAGSMLLTHTQGLAPHLAAGDSALRLAILNGEVFETMRPLANLYQAHNRIPFYNWSASHYCLPKGATVATLAGNFSHLAVGDVLIVAEARGPDTGDPADADPSKRHAVRLLKVQPGGTDPLTGQEITEIEWHAEDALPFALCISSATDEEHGTQEIANVSEARGNIVLADYGRTIGPPVESYTDEDLGTVPERPMPRFRPKLNVAPLTFRAGDPFDGEGPAPQSATSAMKWDLHQTAAAIAKLSGALEGETDPWTFAPDMLAATVDANSRVYTVEAENDGSAYLRFGDNEHGVRPDPGTAFTARYRVGNGSRGNVGAGAIAHLVTGIADIEGVENPLAAMGGKEPESIEHVRQAAPYGFRVQQRAVTAADYAEIANRHPGIQRAAATFRWTGSWYTVFLTVDRLGGAPLDTAFRADLRRFLETYRMAGHDLEIEGARAVPLSVVMHVCVSPDYFQAQVRTRLLAIFTNRVLPDGSLGLFHPDNFTLGGTFYLSKLYAAAQSVDGVTSVRITKFERQTQPGGDGLAKGLLAAGRLEVFSLDNDPNFPERGSFELDLDGGK